MDFCPMPFGVHNRDIRCFITVLNEIIDLTEVTKVSVFIVRNYYFVFVASLYSLGPTHFN
jgi:hypothetical protein